MRPGNICVGIASMTSRMMIDMKLKVSPDVRTLNPEIDFDKPVSLPITADLSIWSSRTPYRSQLEARCARDWIPAQGFILSGYEPKTFQLVGFRYTPDFIGVTADLKVVCIEVKGERRNRRASRMAFRSMAQTYPNVVFCWLEWRDGMWKEEWWNVQAETRDI